jgi:hypothetical protein
LNQQQSGLLKAAELDQQSGFLNGHTSRVPTAAEEEEQEDSSQASLELIQQTRKPEFSAPGTSTDYAFGRLFTENICVCSSLMNWQTTVNRWLHILSPFFQLFLINDSTLFYCIIKIDR